MVIVFLLVNNFKIKQKHAENLGNLQEMVFSLNQKQKYLTAKIQISNQNRTDYTEEIKKIGHEIVELQKVFIAVISNENFK